MSDHDTPDPIDRIYVEAETVLSDEAARAARRARMLAAVEQDATAPMAAAAAAATAPTVTPVHPAWRPNWRRNSWLAAACVAALGVVFAVRSYQPIQVQRPAAHAPAHVANPAPSTIVATPPSPLKPLPTLKASEPPRVTTRVAAPMTAATPPIMAPAAQPAPLPPVASPRDEVAVTGNRLARAAPDRSDVASDRAADKATVAEAPAYAEPAPPPPPPPPPQAAFASGGLDQTTDLLAAAAAGRTGEVEALLARGVSVDAVDAKGDTALMKSVRADHPAVAALLRRHGASLDRKNKAGKSARDMAAAIDDDALNRAIGIER